MALARRTANRRPDYTRTNLGNETLGLRALQASTRSSSTRDSLVGFLLALGATKDDKGLKKDGAKQTNRQAGLG